jgi:hypothetical protein
MNNVMPFTNSRILEIGLYLAEFAVEFVPVEADMNTYDGNDFLLLFDAWYENFIRYAETNSLVTRDERFALYENLNELDGIIKEAAIDAAREAIIAKA